VWVDLSWHGDTHPLPQVRQMLESIRDLFTLLRARGYVLVLRLECAVLRLALALCSDTLHR